MGDQASPTGGSRVTILRRRRSRRSKYTGAFDAPSHMESIDHFRGSGVSALEEFLRICRGARREAEDGNYRS